MGNTSDTGHRGFTKARWVALGFIVAFATSVLTVIYTGLNVEGSRADFDVGFRSVTLSPGETRIVDLVFESEAAHPDAMLEITLPDAVSIRGRSAGDAASIPVAVVTGENSFPVEIEAAAAGSGYLVGRLAAADEAVGIYRVFVTVAPD
jgi:hypothetical protein